MELASFRAAAAHLPSLSSLCVGWRAWALIVAMVVVSHAPELCLSLSSNPINTMSRLSLDLPASPLPGQPGFNDPNTGWVAQALGGLAARTWLHGEIPWWNPYSGIGLPLAAVMQGSALFLPFVLLLALPDGLLWLKMVLQALAGMFAFALLLQLRVSRPVALLGGVLFALNGTFAWMGDAPIMPVSFLPALLLGIERARERAGQARPGGWAWISVGIAGSLFAGFPETAFIDGLLGLAWALFRLASDGRRTAARFAGNVVVGGCVGLLLAMPVLLPFVELLPISDWGVHGLVRLTLERANFAMLLFPAAFGPVDASGDWYLWGSAGGYVGLPVAVLATFALRRNAPHRGLRILLTGWIAFFVLEAINPPVLTWFFDLVSGRGTIWLSRYAPPSWELASIVLAVFAIEDWRDRRQISRSHIARVGIVWLILSLAAIASASSKIRAETAAYPLAPYVFAAGLGITVALTVVAILSFSQQQTRSRLIGLVAAAAAGALCSIWLPQFAGARVTSIDVDALSFLRSRLGFYRLYTTGPLHPNYNAYFELASINTQYLPSPHGWDSFFKGRIDPEATDGALMDWPARRFDAGYERRKAEFRRHLPDLMGTGVKYVVTERSNNPFLALASSDGPDPIARAAGIVALLPGQSLSGSIDPGRLTADHVDAVTVRVGTYANDVDGDLTVELCTRARCVTGALGLASAVGDDASLIQLPSLPVEPGEALRYRIGHAGGTRAFGVFLFAAKQRVAEPTLAPDGPKPGVAPQIVLFSAAAKPQPVRVYSDRLLDIYQLADPAAYFESSAATVSCRRRAA